MSTLAPPRRLAALDALRLIAALAVAAYHFGTSWRLDGVHPPAYHLPTVSHVAIYGFLGVELFFLISGFVIGMSSWGRRLGGFFVSRVTRLYPAYWAGIAVTAVVVSVLPISGGVPGTQGPPRPTDLMVNLTMLQQPLGVPPVDTVYWTLWVELRFYLLFALVVGTGLTYRRIVLFCALWTVAAVTVPTLGQPVLTELIVADYAPYFVAGVAMHLIHRYGPTPLLMAIVGLSWLLSVQRVEHRLSDVHPGFDVPAWPGFLIMTCCYAMLLLVALRRTDRLTWRWMTVAGALTYPFYLLHQRVGYALLRTAHERTELPAWILITGTTMVLLATAWLVHRIVERPLTPLLRRWLTVSLDAARAADDKPTPQRLR